MNHRLANGPFQHLKAIAHLFDMCADRDFFMSAKEAVDYGLIDAVISKPALMASQQGNGASH